MKSAGTFVHVSNLVAAVLACWGALAVPAWSQAKSDSTSNSGIPEVERMFRQPPDDSRIMMRWWWFGPAVEKRELEKEMLLMKQGGIGGFEVQPVYPLALDDPQHGFKNLSYLSDEFLDALRFGSEKAKELGLRMDLTLGSGWPYGGPQVPITEAAGSLRIVRVTTARQSRTVALPNLVSGEELLAVFLVTPKASQAEPNFQLLNDIHDGIASLPEEITEPRDVLFFISSRSGMQVKRAAVGAEGFVLNHYDKVAVEHYLQHVGDRLMQAFSVNGPYAIFCDSLEAYGSDWTVDFLEQFQKRRGYDLRPHLPELVEDRGTLSQGIRRDWGKTLTELFDEGFASTVHEWAQRNHTKFRMQGYGIPPAELSSGALADLPEGEGAQWKSLSATRWASSASHIYGVPVTSSETWTWLHSPVFRATPLDMKAEADRHFLEGINQLIGHGWPYSPESIEYPGWRFYAAAVFDDKNPWWMVMPDVAAYLQRVSFVLRQGRPVNDVAVYLPNDDAWARFRPGHANLFEALQAQVGNEVIAGILHSGFNFDFFDEQALQRTGRTENGTLLLGTNRYRVVVLPNVETISPETYREFESFVLSGGILIATHRLPSIPPGFMANGSDNGEIRVITRRLFQIENAPARFVPDEEKISDVLSAALDPDVSFTPAAPDVGFVHRHLSDAELYFIANTSNQRQTVDATFRVTGMESQWWNAISGGTSAVSIKQRKGDHTTVTLDLEPYASRLLVFSRNRRAAVPAPSRSTANDVIDISNDWRVMFENGSTKTMHELYSWTANADTRFFSGHAMYEKVVAIPERVLHASTIQLDFGEGKVVPSQSLRAGMQAWFEAPIREAAVVYVNGKRAGSIWCPPYSLDVTSLLHAGENSIRVEVANLALNRMSERVLPDYRLLNLRYGTRFEPQDMDKVQPIPAGLFGPIRLIPVGRH